MGAEGSGRCAWDKNGLLAEAGGGSTVDAGAAGAVGVAEGDAVG